MTEPKLAKTLAEYEHECEYDWCCPICTAVVELRYLRSELERLEAEGATVTEPAATMVEGPNRVVLDVTRSMIEKPDRTVWLAVHLRKTGELLFEDYVGSADQTYSIDYSKGLRLEVV